MQSDRESRRVRGEEHRAEYRSVPGKAAQPKTKIDTGHYDVADDPKRGYMLAVALAHGKFQEQGTPILNYALDHFPYRRSRPDRRALCSRPRR